MEVWIKAWSYPYDGDYNITVWSTEKAALKSTCDEIGTNIDNDWDMDNPDMLQYAEEIDELLSKQKYREAMEKWNEFQDNHNADHAAYWHVYEQEVLFGDDVGLVTSAPPMPYKASSPGATCRGPCKNHSPDAYADMADGTYLCRQCRIFQGIFGS